MLYPGLIAVLNSNPPTRDGCVDDQHGQQNGESANNTKSSID